MIRIKIEKTGLPGASCLRTENGYQFIDGYKSKFSDPGDAIELSQIVKLFFSAGPKWLDKLFALRNSIVKLFGLKVPGNGIERERELQNFRCEPEERIGLFKIIQCSENEAVLGEDDKHLDFRVALLLQKSSVDDKVKELTIATLVKFHNNWSKLYFIPVKPFHRLIVPAMLKGIIRELNTRS